MSLLPVSACEIIATGLDHPKCVTVGADSELYCGGEGGQIYRIAADGSEVVEIADAVGECGGIALDAAGNLYECNMTGVVNRISPEGEIEVYSSGTPALPMAVPNYPVFDAAGNLFVSDSGDWDACDGRIYVIRPSGETEPAFPDYLSFPNGMALDQENGWLYVAQSNVRNVIRLRLVDGEIEGRAQIYVSLPEFAVPDGLALSAEGNLYWGGPSAISVGTTWSTYLRRSVRPTPKIAPRSSSRTRSRPGAWPRKVIPPTTRHCCPIGSGSSWPWSSARMPTIRGPDFQAVRRRPGYAGWRRRACVGNRRPR